MAPTNTLAEVLRLLAAPFDAQVRALPAFVVVADELALLFDEEMRRLGQPSGESEALAGSVRSILEELDARLDAMSGAKEHWTQEALQSSADWGWVRERARVALERMGEPLTPIRLDWVTYTRA